MSSGISAKEKRLWLEVSRDHFTAYLHVAAGHEPTLKDIKQLLEKEKITYGIKEDDKINIFLSNMDLYDYTLVIASGKPFSQGKDAELTCKFEKDARSTFDTELSDFEKIDFRQVGTVASVREGEVILRKEPAEQGEEGTTVYGQKLPGEWGMDIHIAPGTGVKLAENKKDFIAEISGAPIISGGVLRVDPVYIVDGDVDYNSGNVTFDGTVAVRGSVLDGFEVNARGDVIVENTIQSARVTAGGDIVVKRGIITRNKGIVSADGDIYAKFIENSTVEAEGNIIVETAVMNSSVYSNKRVVALMEEGAIIGGRTIAYDRVVVRNLGSTAHPRTFVQVGYKYEIQRRYMDELARLKGVMKQLAELQKNYEYATKTSGEDVDKIGEIRGKILKLDRVKKQMQEDIYELNSNRAFNHLSMVEVENLVYPGTAVFVNDSVYRIKKEMKFASFKWDTDKKMLYLTSFDESGREIRRDSKRRAKTVIIIDDSRAVRQTLKLLLEKIGLDVVGEAEDGLEGLELYKKLTPTLVTCDIAMVNMDGVETLKAIRKENENAKVIMISSIRDKKKVLECVVQGAFDYVLKPFVPGRVITVVKSALDN